VEPSLDPMFAQPPHPALGQPWPRTNPSGSCAARRGSRRSGRAAAGRVILCGSVPRPHRRAAPKAKGHNGVEVGKCEPRGSGGIRSSDPRGAPGQGEERLQAHEYAKEDEPQAWEDLIGCIESQGEEDAQCFDGAFGRRVAVRLLYSEVRLLCLTSRFTCKTALFGEPTSGLEPLSPAPATSVRSGVSGRCTRLHIPHK
jgi:hypothetical protein